MTRSALIYTSSMVALGGGFGTGAAILWQPADPAAFLMCLALALLSSTFKVKLPALDGSITPGFVFLLVAVGTLSWSETVAIGAASPSRPWCC